MKPLKTLTMGGTKYEIVDEQARKAIGAEREDIRRSCSTAILNEIEGSSAVVNDSSNNQLVDFHVYGKTTQASTTGAQLLDFSSMTMDSGGTTVSTIINNGQTVTITGTKAYAMGYIDIDVTKLRGQTLYLSGTKSGGNTPSITARLIKIDGTKTYVSALVNGYTVLDDDETISIQLIANNTTTALDTATTATFTNIMVSATKDAAWEPYTGGVASPSPYYPQSINNVEELNVDVYGSNLLPSVYADGMSKTMNGITFEVQPDGGILVNGTATDLAYYSFNYTPNKIPLPNGWLSTSCGNGIGDGRPNIQNDIYVDGEFVTSVQSVVSSSSSREFYGNVELGASRIKVSAGVSIVGQTLYPMLCASKEVLEYEKPLIPQTLTVNKLLCGIPSDVGSTYTDSNNQQWIGDEIDLERGVYIQRLMTYTPTSMASITSDSKNNRGHVKLPRPGLPFSYKDQTGLCSHFKYNTNVYSDTGNELGFIISGETMFFRFTSESSVNTTELGNAWLEEQAAAGTPFTVMYILANPIETPLSDEELAAYKQLYANYPNTTIFNNEGAHMKITYNADTRLFIENYCKTLLEGVNS